METYIIQAAAWIGIILVVLIALAAYLHFNKSLWLRTVFMGIPVNPVRIMLMRMRKSDPSIFLELRIKAAQGNLDITMQQIESLIQANTKDNARQILNAAIMANRAGIPAAISFFQSCLLSGGDLEQLVNAKILADKAGLEAEFSDLAAHHLARGNVKRVVEAMNMAKKSGYDLDFNRAAAVDLSGRDILEIVRAAVQPKVIKTKPVKAVTKDGIQMTVSARITVESDLEQIIGGAGEETIIARVSEGLIAAISSAESYKKILESPGSISDAAWTEDLDEDTAFQILSVEISDAEIGENIGAAQRIRKAETEAELAQAEARRKEQEVRVRMLEMKARILEEEAKIPSAMAKAFSSGKMGIMDYYKLKRLKSDIRDNGIRSRKSEENNDEL